MWITLSWFNFGSIIVSLVVSVYRTVARTYNLMTEFAVDTFSVSSDPTLAAKVNSIYDSIYTLIAVFMLFRITVTMIQYLIDPDKLTDKSAGTGKLITRIIISLGLVITFPTIMNKVYELQDALLAEDSILFKLFEAEDASAASNECISDINSANHTYGFGGVADSDKTNSIGAVVAGCEFDNEVYNAVQQRLDKISAGNHKHYKCSYKGSDINCDTALTRGYYVTTLSYSNKGGTSADVYYTFELDTKEKAEKVDELLGQGYTTTEVKRGTAESLTDLSTSAGGVFAKDIIASFTTEPGEVKKLDIIGSKTEMEKFATEVEEGEYDFDSLLCIICGIVLIVVMLILCIEVLIRNLKLLILQILAPIAFISYMNPNDKILNNWFSKFLGCYLDLFIKILSIRVAIYLVSLISSSLGGGLQNILVYLAIFIFVKTIPNLISDVFGIKNMGGTFKESMGALKNAAFMGAGAIAGGTVGLVSGMGAGASLSTVAGGLIGGAFRGGAAGARGNVGNIRNAVGQQRQANINARTRNQQEGSSFWGRTRSSIAHAFGQMDAFDRAESRSKIATDAVNDIKNYEDESSKTILKMAGMMKSDNGGNYTNDSFGEFAKASAELAAYDAGDTQGRNRFDLDAKVRQTKKDALADYTDMLRTSTTDSAGNLVSNNGNKYFDKCAEDNKKNNDRLFVTDKSMIAVDNDKYYAKDAKNRAENVISDSAREMAENRVNHIAANNGGKH